MLAGQMNRMNEEKELPKGWVWTTVSKIGKTITGNTPSTSRPEFYGGNIPFFKPSDLGVGYALNKAETTLTEAGAISARVLPAHSVLVTCIGATIGKTGFSKVAGATNQQINALVPNDAIVLPQYAYFAFISPVLFHQILENASSTTLPILNKSKFEALEFPLPPLPEQRRIVAKLEELFSRLDAGVAAVRQTQKQLKRYRQSVLHAAVTGELTRAWRETHPQPAETGAALLARIRAERRAQWEASQVAKRGGQMALGEGWKKKYEEPAAVDTSELLELPEGWIWASTEQLCTTVASGSTPTSEELFEGQGEVPFLKVYNLTKTGKLDFSIKPTYIRQAVHNALLNRSKTYPGDVLMNIVGPPLGKISLVPTDHPEWNINQAIVVFRASSGYSNRFLLTCLLTETILKWILKTAKNTTSQVNLSVTMCRQIPLPVPPLAEQAEIVAEAERRLSTIDALEQTLADELKRAERLRQSLLHRAFTGRLVPQDATDEPASELLARLRGLAAQAPLRKGKEQAEAGTGEAKRRGHKPKGTAEAPDVSLPAGTQISLAL